MQHVIIGTAGHIDHGKTTLIKALTGRETDTLKEEKDRGISINLGFTYFDLPSGNRAGIVDVPGHERFIKNALAGIGGIDLVLLVIAGDEGVMPQTREHINILELLDIKNGIVVITKTDMVDSEWLDMITEEIRKEISTSFLKNAPIAYVDSLSGRGIRELTEKIDEMTGNMGERDISSDFRIPVDRVFTISGFGTVITGTLIAGTINNGDACQIYPSEAKSKIRNIQVHDKNVDTAYSGQRVAVNLANIKTGEVERGDVVSKIGYLKNSMMLDCRLKYLKDAPRPLKNRDRVRVYHGTSELLGRVMILDKEEVKPGETALIQIRLEGTIAARQGDKYVIRSYSPLFTIGGGTILDPNPGKHKLKDGKVLEGLLIKEKGSPKDIVEQAINGLSSKFPRLQEVAALVGMSQDNTLDIIKELAGEGRIYTIELSEGDILLHANFLNGLKLRAIAVVDEFHGSNPLKLGMSREEFKSRVFGGEIKQRVFDKLVDILKQDTIWGENNYLWNKRFKVRLSPRQEEIREKIQKCFAEGGFQPPKPEEVLKAFGREEKAAKMVFDSLIEMGVLVKLNEEVYLLRENLDKARDLLVSSITKNGEITAGQFRDEIGASRKYAVAILEYFDGIKLTKRLEDKRVLA